MRVDAGVRPMDKTLRPIPHERLRVAFLPYQAAMWDSLRTVWESVEADPDAVAMVMPLPYDKLDASGGVEQHCAGENIPGPTDCVPADMDALRDFAPHVVYIHNVYDALNRVTRVDPRFHTDALRGLGALVVYVPYFFMGASVPPAQAAMPTYENVDVVALQTQAHIDQMGEQYRSRCVAVGTPKTDWVLRSLDRAPAETHDDTVILVVSSITEVLASGAGALLRLAEIFAAADEMDGVQVIWRPHPLLISTIVAMRSDLRGPYAHLLRMAAGLSSVSIDLSNDYAASFRGADACVAMSATSLPLMFGLTGRPVMFVNAAQGSEEEAPAVDADGKPPRFGVFDDLHPWSCAEINGDVDFPSFVRYVRRGRHDAVHQREAMQATVGPVDGHVGRRLHSHVARLVRDGVTPTAVEGAGS